MLKLSSSKSSSREMGIVVRPARAQDAPFIRAMAQNAFLAYGSYDRYLEDWFENDAVTTSIAELDGRAAGFSMITAYADPERPRENVADLVAELNESPSVEEVNRLFETAANGDFAGVLTTTSEELVSSDFIGNPHSAIVDLPLTRRIEAAGAGALFRVVAWYDNEWGHAARLADILELLARVGPGRSAV